MDEQKDIENETEGEELVEQVLELAGLPDDAARDQLDSILEESGFDGENLTLEELRAALIAYIEKQIEAGPPEDH